MKKYFLLAILLLSITAAHAKPSVITGTWNREYAKVLKLYYPVSGRLVEQASCSIQEGGKFGFAFYPAKEGFYTIGDENTSDYINKYTFYFKPGDDLHIAVNDSTYVLVGKNTPENELMDSWHKKTQQLEWKSFYFIKQFGAEGAKKLSTYVDFFPELEVASEFSKTFKANTPNSTFNELFDQYKEVSLIQYALYFISTPKTAYPQAKDYTAFFHNISYGKLVGTTLLFSIPLGAEVISSLPNLKRRVEGVVDYEYTMDSEMSFFKNDTLKGETVLYEAGLLKTCEGFDDFSKEYGKYILTADQKQRFKDIKMQLVRSSENLQTYKFEYPDTNGKLVKLDDFKGKVVVVDIWATWCGPCKEQLPHVKRLEKEFHGKDIVFVGVSVDKPAHKQKWLDFVEKEGLDNVQLFAGQGAEIMEFYSIKGIPRFLVYNKKGELISANAPSPSKEELKNLLERELAK